METLCEPPSLPKTPILLVSLPSSDVLWQVNISIDDDEEIALAATPRIASSTRERLVAAAAKSGVDHFRICDSTGKKVVEEYWNVGMAR